jgi:1,4-alpha-glucan branching enzyme
VTEAPVGTFCLVLHSHLPWLAHHGAWPVGEEWLHQAWGTSYTPVLEVLRRLGEQGRTGVLTLGVTPVLAAQLDDPYCLREQHTWLGYWLVRAEGAAAEREPIGVAGYEAGLASETMRAFEARYAHGVSPVLRNLSDSGVVEILGGPLAHPFVPLLDERVARAAIEAGLEDTRLRLGRRPDGVWNPECALRPGIEDLYAAAGVRRLVVDSPAVHGKTSSAVRLGRTDVAAFPRDLEVSYRVWSPRSGYPGGKWYRDFHTWDHPSGLRPARVTSQRTASQDKRPYEPERARAAVEHDARDFVTAVRDRLVDLGPDALVVAAYDTELFGHWWHEGPLWLERVLTLLPDAGVRVSTLAGAEDQGLVRGRLDPVPTSSWGAGKDWHIWDGEPVRDIADANTETQQLLLKVLDADPTRNRDALQDSLFREAMLALASDWAFLVSHEGAVQYARDRARDHAHTVREIAHALLKGDREGAARNAATAERFGRPWGRLDAGMLP